MRCVSDEQHAVTMPRVERVLVPQLVETALGSLGENLLDGGWEIGEGGGEILEVFRGALRTRSRLRRVPCLGPWQRC